MEKALKRPLQNVDLRAAAIAGNVAMWEIAERMGVCEATIRRRYRYELPEETKKQILTIIAEIAEERRKG